MQKKQKTKRLFYKKYPYKIECFVPNGYYLRYYIKDKEIPYYVSISDTTLTPFWEKLKPLQDSVKIRIENNFISIYTTDQLVFEKATEELGEWVTCTWEPENQEFLNFLSEGNGIKVLCVQYPHNKYRYKICVNLKTDEDIKTRFANWVKNYPDNILVNKGSLAWFRGEYHVPSYTTFTPYLYVSDQKMLSMVCLFLGKFIGRIEEYILKESINTTL